MQRSDVCTDLYLATCYRSERNKRWESSCAEAWGLRYTLLHVCQLKLYTLFAYTADGSNYQSCVESARERQATYGIQLEMVAWREIA